MTRTLFAFLVAAIFGSAAFAQADLPGVNTAYRALPTKVGNAKQPAHYQHVYVTEGSPESKSVQTISLKDAVEYGVLASSDYQVQKLDAVGGLNWIVLDTAPLQPRQIEGIGGEGVDRNNSIDVNFDVDKTEILNKQNLESLFSKSKRVQGIFYVFGYADETGTESKNETLSEQRAQVVVDSLVEMGVNISSIKSEGSGVSYMYPTLAANRHTSITFIIKE